MKYRSFGNTGVKLSAVGLGCMGMSAAYGTEDDEESLKTLNRSIELGVNFWDTSDTYGNGKNERLISNVLTENRDKVFIATKFGFRLKEGSTNSFTGETYLDCSPKHVREAAEASLERLGVDCIDLYYAHRVDPNVPVEDTVAAMAELVDEGKVKYLGLSECTPEDLQKAMDVHPIAAVQSEYSILTRGLEDRMIPLIKELGISLVPFSPMSRGLLTNKLAKGSIKDGDFRSVLPRYSGEYFENNLLLAQEFEDLAKSIEATPAQLAIAWVLAQGDFIIPIPGTKKRKYLEENVRSVDVNVSRAVLAEIDEIIERHPNIGPRYNQKQDKFVKK